MDGRREEEMARKGFGSHFIEVGGVTPPAKVFPIPPI